VKLRSSIFDRGASSGLSTTVLFAFLLYSGAGCFGQDGINQLVDAPQLNPKILGLHSPLAGKLKNSHGMKDISVKRHQFGLFTGRETFLGLLPDHLPVLQSDIHGELPASGPLCVKIADPEGGERHQSGKQRAEKCKYCGSVSDEKVEKFFHDLFKAGVVITLCNGLVVVPLWWWTLRRRPFLDIKSWANVQELATPLARASVETGVKVNITGDVFDRAASGGCPASPCSASSITLAGLRPYMPNQCQKLITRNRIYVGKHSI
jgi:hypothetical protein